MQNLDPENSGLDVYAPQKAAIVFQEKWLKGGRVCSHLQGDITRREILLGVVEDGTNCIVDSFVFDLKELYDVCLQCTEQIWGRLINVVWLFYCCILLSYVA